MAKKILLLCNLPTLPQNFQELNGIASHWAAYRTDNRSLPTGEAANRMGLLGKSSHRSLLSILETNAISYIVQRETHCP